MSADRIGHAVHTAAELMAMQETIRIMNFGGFSVLCPGEVLTLRHVAGRHVVGPGPIAEGSGLVLSGRG